MYGSFSASQPPKVATVFGAQHLFTIEQLTMFSGQAILAKAKKELKILNFSTEEEARASREYLKTIGTWIPLMSAIEKYYPAVTLVDKSLKKADFLEKVYEWLLVNAEMSYQNALRDMRQPYLDGGQTVENFYNNLLSASSGESEYKQCP